MTIGDVVRRIRKEHLGQLIVYVYQQALDKKSLRPNWNSYGARPADPFGLTFESLGHPTVGPNGEQSHSQGSIGNTLLHFRHRLDPAHSNTSRDVSCGTPTVSGLIPYHPFPERFLFIWADLAPITKQIPIPFQILAHGLDSLFFVLGDSRFVPIRFDPWRLGRLPLL